MARYLITQSLLSAWDYTFSCHEGSEDSAYEDFLRTLNREKGEPTEAMQNGIMFESAVYATTNGTFNPAGHCWESGIRKVAAILGNAPVQVKAQREITVDGMDFLVYGVLDALKAGTIYDVKFKNKGFGSLELAGSYLDSAQHPAYFYIVPEAFEFKYLVSDGTDIYVEPYRPEETRFIGDIISEFIQSLAGWGLLDLYKEKWLTK